MSVPILDVRNLTVQFKTASGAIRAVNDISFQVARGQTLGIVGESGSGKSVTSLSVMGLVPSPPGEVTQGEIYFQAQEDAAAVDLRTLSPQQMQALRGEKVSMIFQEPMSSLNPVYTCGFQLTEAILQHQNISREAAVERAIARLQEVKLLPSNDALYREIEATQPTWSQFQIQQEIERRQQDMLNRFPHELSGGQIQRVMIAMAIACNPTLLIADEPTTALDVTVQASTLDLLRELRDRRGMSMIFITHDLGIIAEIADQVAVMYQGNIVESGSVWEIFSNPQHPYTKGLLACRPQPDQRLRRLPTVTDFMATTVDAQGETVLIEKRVVKPNGLNPAQSNQVSIEEAEQRLQRLENNGPLLTVENLQVGYPVRGVFGNTRRYVMAVNQVSFQINTGETFGLVGESGCGKTTLGRALLRLVPHMGGHVWFNGQDVLTLQGRALRKLRRDMQIIFQDPFSSLDPRMSIGAAIAEPLKIHKVARSKRNQRERVAYLLERVGIDPGCVKRFPHEFSGGQRQRICIARALALNPKFIICDESVSALDVSVQAQVLNLLKELQAEFNLTYIFISHDLAVVKFMSDRIMVMNRGRVEEIGPADQIYYHPQQAYTQQLISAIPIGSLDRIQELQAGRKAIAS
ncbi:MAG: ABC transporter ATP-binding protein [Leptolyngbya sp. SIO1E4]|nr:ABC transporter ATP-binding protein [Leptolyngbya sp. SIO1E4]